MNWETEFIQIKSHNIKRSVVMTEIMQVCVQTQLGGQDTRVSSTSNTEVTNDILDGMLNEN